MSSNQLPITVRFEQRDGRWHGYTLASVPTNETRYGYKTANAAVAQLEKEMAMGFRKTRQIVVA